MRRLLVTASLCSGKDKGPAEPGPTCVVSPTSLELRSVVIGFTSGEG